MNATKTFAQYLSTLDLQGTSAEAHNILNVLTQADTVDILDGMGWYREAKLYAESLAGWLKVLHPTDSPSQLNQRAAGILAVLSPRQNWHNNKRYALAVAKLHVLGAPDLLELLPVFEANRVKACALASEPWSEGLINDYVRGPKVTAFYKNILGDVDEITLDTHAINLARGVYEPNPKQPNADERCRIELAYEVARTLMERWLMEHTDLLPEGHGLTLPQVQAIAWVTWRRIHHGHNHKLG